MAHEGALTRLERVTTVLETLAALQQESMGATRLPGSGTFAFRYGPGESRKVPVGLTASKHDLPAGYFDQGGDGYKATSYLVVNPNACYVRLRGSPTSTHLPVTASTGRVFPPHFIGVFSTLYPVSMSAIAVAMPSFPLPAEFVPLEVFYGGGT